MMRCIRNSARCSDFQALVAAAKDHGLELALDFAIQCAPDHPWLSEHPEWFDWRPDGSLRYAENPPKKYEDIVNVDFYTEGAQPSLWIALRDVVQFWVDQGIRLFRVDNPHTKPFPFWEWLIADIRARHPDAVFLAEAFTRPKIMYRLAKIGFSQSYTYFTWRNNKTEIQDYLTELTTTAPKDFFRPHFFVNTPDINPLFLQTSGRGGFLIRAALATTLSGLWGMYNGFELCEATPVPGREEYLNSEKYEIKAWDYDRPGNIVAEISQLNRIRRANAALHSHLNVEFLPCDNPQVVYFRKFAADGNTLLVAISVDPFNIQDATIELPLWRFGLPDHGRLAAEDLMRDAKIRLVRGNFSRSVSTRSNSLSAFGASPQPVRTDMKHHPEIATVDDPSWYKDAVIYQVHVKSFYDSNNDGVGDFSGPDREARLYRRPRRQCDLAAALLSFAASRRWLRYFQLPQRASGIWHDGGCEALHP